MQVLDLSVEPDWEKSQQTKVRVKLSAVHPKFLSKLKVSTHGIYVKPFSLENICLSNGRGPQFALTNQLFSVNLFCIYFPLGFLDF